MKRSTKVLVGIYALSVLLYGLFYISRSFTDFYVTWVFRPISGLAARVSGLLPFSLAEWTIAVFVIYVLVGLIFSIGWLVLKKGKRFGAFQAYGKSVAWVLGVALLLCTLNWFSLYRATEMSELHLTPGTHDAKEWLELIDYVTEEMAQLEPVIERDAEGYFVLRADIHKAPQEAMKKLAQTFPELKGYYPQAKPLHFSFYMSQTGTTGIYLPLYIEANYNDHIVDAQLPSVVCHELSHVKGIIQENEANFFGMLACVNSDDPDMRYGGYLDMLGYLLGDEPDFKGMKEEEARYKRCLDRLSDEVFAELYRYFPDNYWEEHEEEVIIPTDVIDHVENVVYDTTLQINGVEDGIASYGRVTNCLLDYFSEHHTLTVE